MARVQFLEKVKEVLFCFYPNGTKFYNREKESETVNNVSVRTGNITLTACIEDRS